jgi:hypothetical protein
LDKIFESKNFEGYLWYGRTRTYKAC